MPGTRAEGIFEELKKVFEPWKHLAKCFGTPTWPLNSFGTPTTKLKTAQKFVLPVLQFRNSSRTPDTEQKKITKSLLV